MIIILCVYVCVFSIFFPIKPAQINCDDDARRSIGYIYLWFHLVHQIFGRSKWDRFAIYIYIFMYVCRQPVEVACIWWVLLRGLMSDTYNIGVNTKKVSLVWTEYGQMGIFYLLTE